MVKRATLVNLPACQAGRYLRVGDSVIDEWLTDDGDSTLEAALLALRSAGVEVEEVEAVEFRPVQIRHTWAYRLRRERDFMELMMAAYGGIPTFNGPLSNIGIGIGLKAD